MRDTRRVPRPSWCVVAAAAAHSRRPDPPSSAASPEVQLHRDPRRAGQLDGLHRHDGPYRTWLHSRVQVHPSLRLLLRLRLLLWWVVAVVIYLHRGGNCLLPPVPVPF